MRPSDETAANKVMIPNMTATRWAVASDFDPWELWEPSLGKRGIHWKNLFDHTRGGHKEMMFGISFLPPGSRYTRHFHDQPEIYYVLSGHGIIYAGDDAFNVTPGSFFYLPKKCIHGAVAHGNQPLHMLYVFGTETVGSSYDRSFVEDVALDAHKEL
jgi:quercetin dioxygenase-like cupin family protein